MSGVQQKNKLDFRDIILGGQDGIVNVLGVVLGVAAATNDLRIVIISGLAATFAESISMAAVAYTSTEAQESQLKGEVQKEIKEIESIPESEISEVREIFSKWGFEGDLLEKATEKITSNKELWLKFMVSEELNLSEKRVEKPSFAALVVGLASTVGSLIPLIPFFIQKDVVVGMYLATVLSAITLFAVGFVKAKLTVGNPLKSGAQITVIGIASALVGFLIGKMLGGVQF